MDAAELRFAVPGLDGGAISGLLAVPAGARAAMVLAHGAGAGMNHPFMAAVAAGLAARGIAVLRYQFPYMEARRPRPDPPAVAAATVRAAVAEAGRHCAGLPLIAAGKSFGGRMTSVAAAEAPLPGVVGLVFFGFPLHPPVKPSDSRAMHLPAVSVPMLFLQGARDDLAALPLLEPLCARLGPRATLHVFPDADHSFHVPVRSGRRDADVREEMLDITAAWIDARLGSAGKGPL